MFLKSPGEQLERRALPHHPFPKKKSSACECLNAQDYKGNTALHYSVSRKTDLDVVGLLQEHGADSNMGNKSGQTPLAIAISMDADFEAIIYPLLKSGANLVGGSVDPNAQDWDGNTSLHYLVASDSTNKGVDLLLEKGANPNLPNKFGETPIHVAAGAGQTASSNLEMLLDRGGNPNSKTLKGESPLMFAISGYMPSTAAVRILVEAGAGPECVLKTQPHVSLLERAISQSVRADYNPSNVVALMLRAGADPLVPASNGDTLEEFARNPGEKRIADMLSW